MKHAVTSYSTVSYVLDSYLQSRYIQQSYVYFSGREESILWERLVTIVAEFPIGNAVWTTHYYDKVSD